MKPTAFKIHRMSIYLVDSVIDLLNKGGVEFRRGKLKDIHEGQGDYWPYKEAQPIRSGSCVPSDVVSSLAGRPRYVTDDCFIQVQCVSSLTANGVCTAYKEGGVGVGGCIIFSSP